MSEHGQRIPFSEQRAKKRQGKEGSLVPRYESRFRGFHNLMRYRVREILLVSTLYDAWVLEEDQNLSERIFSEYLNLDLRYIPRITRVNTGAEALEMIQEKSFSLVLSMMRLPDMTALELRQQVKHLQPRRRIIFLTYDTVDRKLLDDLRDKQSNDRIFYWLRDTNVLLSIVKYVEDQRNAPRDARAGVQIVLLVEDSPRYFSMFMPLIYTELVTQTRRLIDDGINLIDRIQRLRARPKVLLAETFEQALSIFQQYKHNILGIISDVRFPLGGEPDPEAGFKLAARVRDELPLVPFILHSSELHFRALAHDKGLDFLHKLSENLSEELRDCIKNNFGFGDFSFRRPNGEQVTRARDIRQFIDALIHIPEESLIYHSSHNHFSTWLMARTEFALAERVRALNISDFEDTPSLREGLVSVIKEHTQRQHEGIVGDYRAGRLRSSGNFVKIGAGSLGGKARGLAFINALLARNQLVGKYEGATITIPNTFVLCTDIFEEFISSHHLSKWAIQEDNDQVIVQRFLESSLPPKVRLDLLSILQTERYPIAVRSSSLLEDNQALPFAGIYKTFMLPNNHSRIQVRLQQLCDAIRLVYASIYSKASKEYTRNTGYRVDEERMAVVIQQIAGTTHHGKGDEPALHYPLFSGVARSYNYYPYADLKPEEGTASLALGLGKAVVESEKCFHFCPARPQMNPPYASAEEFLDNSQTHFYALDVSDPGVQVTAEESFSLKKTRLARAERDGTLQLVASTYCAQNRVIRDSLMTPGPRVVRFAQILKYGVMPLAEIIQDLLEAGERSFGSPVEIEFAVDAPPVRRANASQPSAPREALFHFLQIRPVVMGDLDYRISEEALLETNSLCTSISAMGNGIYDDLFDVIFIKPETFDILKTREIADELEDINDQMIGEDRRYILLGFGRWGTSDPSLGVPVQWNQVSQAQIFIESDKEDLWVEPSQGSHFFQNMVALRLGYFFIKEGRPGNHVDWDWLMSQRPYQETAYLRHLRAETPFRVEVDGHASRAIVHLPRSTPTAS